MKRLALYILFLGSLSLACRTLIPQAPASNPPTSPVANGTSTSQSQAPVNIIDVSERLEQLGGEPCTGNRDFTCITINVPLDHFDPANTEMIDVVFAVAPATGTRKGMYVQAFPGGPGGEGISYASRDYFSRQIQRQYDIVFFDQRGIGLSNPLECKRAYSNYFLGYLNADDSMGEEGYDTSEEQQTA